MTRRRLRRKQWLKIFPLFIVGCIFLMWLYCFETPVIHQDFYYVIEPGTSLTDLTEALNDEAHLPFPFLFHLFARLRMADHHLKAGEYIFPEDSSMNDILNRVVRGEVLYRDFTIVDGWTFKQVLTELNKNIYIQHEIGYLSPVLIAEKVGCPYKTLEGLLYPDTYRYTRGTTDTAILKWAYQNMQTALNKEWMNRSLNTPYKTPYEALIVASLVEKEAKAENERPIIAGIILKRLAKHMLLQIDSTVIFGLGDTYQGKLTRVDLQKKTPYNTYLRLGLPPTPIAMPSEKSIAAALHPVKTDALYFVAKGDGTHQFSATLEEHHLAVDQYIRDK
ncbi:MAG: hypothetical protein A2X77_01980 [Gammaproteobacteria bacterium GWE2_42_36]|nr:MAG: hypothetical protein A2X77_01980 [Gammaproteobacteria bacterium GWE2_42_36]HCU04933.1 endolytic transglycosylase MltG [Coxiellaceae bacterium]